MTKRKKQLPVDEFLRYSHGEGRRKYLHNNRARIEAYNARIKEEEEKRKAEEERRREEFVQTQLSSVNDEMPEDVAAQYKQLLALREQLTDPTKVLERLTANEESFVPTSLLNRMDNVKQELKDVNDSIADIESKYSPKAFIDAGVGAGFQYVLQKAGITGQDSVPSKRDSSSFEDLSTDSPIVSLDTTGVDELYLAVNDSNQIWTVVYGDSYEDYQKAQQRTDAVKLISDAYNRAKANYEYDVQQETVQKPKGYGSGFGTLFSSTWWNDAIGTYLLRLNDTQAENFLGRIDVSNERLTRARNAVKYLDAIDRHKKFVQRQKSGEQISYAELEKDRNTVDEIANLKNDYYYIQSLIPGGGIFGEGRIVDDISTAVKNAGNWLYSQAINRNPAVQALSEYNLKINPNYDKSSAYLEYGAELFDHNDTMRDLLRGIDSTDPNVRWGALKRFEDANKKQQDEWAKGAKMNFEESEKAKQKYKVSDWFKQLEGTVSDDFFDLDSWLYKQPGLMGASQSSALKSWTATALNLGASAIGGGFAAKLATAATTLPLSISASQEENYSEVSENFKNRFKRLLKANGEYDKFVKEASEKLNTTDEDEIFNRFLLGEFVPTSKKLLEIAAQSSYGLGALHQRDMMATTFDDVFNTALELTPLGYLAKSTKIGRYALNGAAAGPAGIAVGAALGKIADSSIGKSLSKRVSGVLKFAEKVPDKMLGKYSIFGKSSIPHRVLGPKGYLRYAAVKDVVKGTAKRAGLSAISEGIEEGKQYLNAQRYIQGRYDDSDYEGLLGLNRIIDDAKGLAKSAMVMAGFPFSMSLTDDAELIANIKGGMKGGFMQTGVTTAVLSIPGLTAQLKYQKDLLSLYQNAIFDKTQERDLYEKGIMFAKSVAGGVDFNTIDASVDQLKSYVRGIQGKSQDDIDAVENLLDMQRNMAKLIYNIFQSSAFRQALQDNGMSYDSEEAYKLASLINLFGEHSQDAENTFSEKKNILELAILKLESPFTVEEGTKNVIDQRILKHSGNVIESYVEPLESKDKEGNPVTLTGQDLASERDARFRYSVNNLANIAALVQLKNDILSAKQNGDVKFEKNKKDVDFLLKYIDSEIARYSQGIVKDKREKYINMSRDLLSDIENRDDLISAARQMHMAAMEQDYFNTLLNGLFGEYKNPGKDDKNPLATSKFGAKEFIEQVDKSIERDYLLAQQIEQEWQNVQQQRFDDQEKLVKSKLEKAAKKAKKEAEEAAKRNRPKSTSESRETNENGKSRKKRKTLADRKKNKKSNKNNQNLKPTDENDLEIPSVQQTQQAEEEQPVQQTLEVKTEQPQPVSSTEQPQVSSQQLTTVESQTKPKEDNGIVLGTEAGDTSKRKGIFASYKDREEFQRLAHLFHNNNMRLHSGIDGENLLLATKMMYLLLKGAAVNITEAAKTLIRVTYDGIRPYIKEAYSTAKQQLISEGLSPVGFSTDEEIAAFDPQNFDNVPSGPDILITQQPTAEAGDSLNAASKDASGNEQQKAFDRLVQKTVDDEDKVKIELRTGHDYFIEIDGKLTMFPRVHDYLDPEYTPNDQEAAHQRKVTEDLRAAYKKGLLEFNKVALDFAKKFNEEFLGRGGFLKVVLDTYLKYVKDNPNEVEDVIEAIAVLTSRIPADYSVIIGSLVDDICRLYFSGNTVHYTPEIASYITEEAFVDLIDELQLIKKHYNDLGWVLFARPIRFYTTVYDTVSGKTKRVAGETDMIAVDKDGHYHIIDFKTSYKSYARSVTSAGTIYNNLDIIDPQALNDRRFKVRTTRQYYTDQQSLYNLMIQLSLAGSVVDSMELLPFVVKYAFTWVERKTSLGNGVAREFLDAVPVYSVTNKSQIVRDDGTKVRDEQGDPVLEILRVPIEMSTGIAQRFLTQKQTEKLRKIFDSFSVEAEDVYNELTDREKADVSNNVLEDIRNIVNEYGRISKVQPQTIDDWVSLFKLAESLSDRSKLAIQMMYEDLNKADNQRRANHEYTTQELLLMDEIFDHPDITLEEVIAGSFRNEVYALSTLVQSLYDRKIFNIDGVSSEELTLISDHIASIEKTLRDYPFVEQLRPKALEYYKYSVDWVNKYLGPIDQTGVPVQLINPSFIKEYTEAWRYITSTWKQSIDGSVGIENAVAEDNPSMKLLDVTANPDFITNGVFELKVLPVIINGKRQNRLHLIVHYGGHTYKPVSMHTAEGSDIFTKVLHMQRLNPNKHVVVSNYDVSRTNGRMRVGERKSIVERRLVDPWDIEYTSTQKRFGITRIRKNPKTGVNEIVVIVPGFDGGIRLELYNFGTNDSLRPGMLFMMVNPTLNERTNAQPSVPVRIEGSTLTKGDAELILGILKGDYALYEKVGDMEIKQLRKSLDSEFVENGIGKGFTCRQVLNLLIPYGGRVGENKRVLHVAYDSQSTNIVHLYGYIEGEEYIRNDQGDIIDLDNAYDISTEAGANAFLERLSHVKVNIDERIISLRLLSEVSDKHPFAGIKHLMDKPSTMKQLAEGKTIHFGNSRLLISMSDLEDSNHKHEMRGISGLGYYAKLGLLESEFGGIENALVAVENNPQLIVTEDLTPQGLKKQETVTEALQKVESIFETDSFLPDFRSASDDVDEGLLEMPKVQTEKPKVKLDSEEKVRKHLRRIFGKLGVPVQIIDPVIRVLQQNASIVGLCYADGIKLSKEAARGTEYHEAFHRVIEILTTKEQRDKIYDLYRSANGMKIPKTDKERENSDKVVRELIADDFMYFMSGQPKFFVSKLWKTFKLIKSWSTWISGLNEIKLLWFYTRVGVLGSYRNKKAVVEDRNRFASMFKEGLPMVINGKPFEHILNRRMYKLLRKTLVLCVLEANNVDPSGNNIQNVSLDKDILKDSKTLAWCRRLKKDNITPENVKRALDELLDNWDSIKDDIAQDISKISTDYHKRYQLENEEDAESYEDAAYAQIEQHVKASYEFSAFSRTSSRVRFFLSRVPQRRWGTKNGEKVAVAQLNELGLPQYMDSKFVYNSLLNKLHDIRNKKELLNRLKWLSENDPDPMYEYVYNNLKALADSSKTNINDSQLFTQLYGSIRQAKLEFEIAKSSKNANGEYLVNIISAGSEYSARNYKNEWSDSFANGGCPYVKRNEDGRIVMNGMSASIFNSVAVRLQEIAYAVSDKSFAEGAQPRTVGGILVDISKDSDVEGLKRNLVHVLNCLGIQFDKSMLDYMLLDKYKNSGVKGLNLLFSQQFDPSETSTTSSFELFIRLINELYVNGKLNINENNQLIFDRSVIDATKLFNGKGAAFISELSTYKYNYRHAHDLLSVLVTKGNRFYVMSENNLITDITAELRDAMHGIYSEDVNNGMMYDYNIFSPEGAPIINGRKQMCGSIIYKMLDQIKYDRTPRKITDRSGVERNETAEEVEERIANTYEALRFITFGGFRSDDPSDIGEDYMEISEREDYISKISILLDGGMLSPTMSDKKSWGYLRGVPLKGIDHKHPYSVSGLNKFNLDGSMSQLHSVSQQIWEYIMCERRAIGNLLREMNGYTDELGIEHPKISDEEKIDNYHGITVTLNKGKSNEKKINVVQGARFTSLLGVYEIENGEEKYIEFNRILDENGNVLNEQDNLDIADKAFFLPKTITDAVTGEERLETEDEVKDRQIKQIEYVLLKQLVDELEYAEKLGLIERDANLEGRPTIELYRNVGLDSNKITRIAKELAAADSIKWESLTEAQNAIKDLYKARAIAVLINDIMVKHIQSIEEFERVFSGNPAFFKFKYNDEGHLVDRTTDESKRFGGLVSTGLNNDLELGLSDEYVQAEVDEANLPNENIDQLEKLFMEGEIRGAYLNYLLSNAGITVMDSRRAKDIAKQADTMSLEEIRQNLPKDIYDIAVQLAQGQVKKFRTIEDVANGSAFITDEMCENLLRMAGAWNDKIEKAFIVLRGNVASALEQEEAYNLIFTTVIGSQKYTAYGFRNNRNTQIPYYNKMALFPMFKCICTGNMAKIYDKMKQEGVDILCVKSAVKIGGQGSQPINWEDYNDDYTFEENFHFNTYTLPYSRLRKQFNTDPSGKETMHIGTQMLKVALSVIMAGRDYTLADGTVMTADEILSDIMNTINALSDVGYANIMKQFFDEDNKFDVEKFSKFLTEELLDRDASQELIDAVSIIKDGKGKPHLKVPLAALSNLNFIQSIIVSKVNKEVVDINTPGAPFIQRSAWSMEGETRVLGDSNLPKNINRGNRLQMINEEGSMDCVLSIDFFDDIIPKKKDGSRLSFEEAKQYLIDNGIISGYTSTGEWSNAKANIIGYRIPTQAISSIHALRCVDVIPAVRDTVILPLEFVTITGSDFDIDKLYLSRKNYRRITEEDVDWATSSRLTPDSALVHAESGIYDIKHRKLTDKFAEGTSQHLQNKLLDDYIALLCDTYEDENGNKISRSVHMLHAAIDAHTELITDIVKDFESDVLKQVLRPFDAYVLRKQCQTKDAFATGKFGIGPFALNNNSHILTMLYDVKFATKKGDILTRLNKTSLSRRSDDDGKSILAWLSGLINIHVDAAKDPVADKLNVGKYTYNLVNLMIRTGFGKKTFWFTSQPIMRVLAEAYSNAQSSYMANTSVSKYRRYLDSEESIIINFAKANGYNDALTQNLDKVLSAWRSDISRTTGVEANDVVDYLLSDGADILRNIGRVKYSNNKDLSSEDKYNAKIKGKDVMLSFFDIQMAVFQAKKQFDPYAEALADLVKYSKIDTKKQGKTVPEQQQYLRGVKKLFGRDSKSSKRQLFDTKSLDRLYTQSYIEHKTDKATSAFLQIMSNTAVQGTSAFLHQVGELMDVTDNDDFGNADTIKTISGELLAQRKAQFFVDYAESNDIDINTLFNGLNTLYDKLGRLKILIATDPKYAQLRDASGEVKNYLLKTLIQGYRKSFSNSVLGSGDINDEYDNVKFLDTFTFIDDESVDADDFSEAWEDLLFDDQFPELQQFARELIVYSFFTAGDNGGNHDLFKFVPNSWKVNPNGQWIVTDEPYSEDSYAYFMASLLEKYNVNHPSIRLTEEDIDDVVLNNWFDYTFINEERIVKNGETRFIPVYAGQLEVERTVDRGNGPAIEKIPERVSYASVLQAITVKDGVSTPTYYPNEAPMYIKLRRGSCGDKESQRRFVIYKYAGEGLRVEGDSRIFYPIYVQVDARGNKLQRGNRILSYRRLPKRLEALPTVFKANPLFNLFKGAVENEDPSNYNLPYVFNRAVRAYATKWSSEQQQLGRTAAGSMAEVLTDAARRIRPDDIPLELVEEWSKKEGWSVDYFYEEVYPNVDEAWQLEFEYVDTDEKAAFSGRMDYSFEDNGRPDLSSLTTLEAIKRGERTATTRYEHDGRIDSYWSYVKVGDIIEFHDDKGNSVKVRCTKALSPLREVFDGVLPEGAETKNNSTTRFTYSRYPEGKPNYEVSSAGDSRFSAMNAKFAAGTKLLGHDVGGRTIESVYLHGVKQGDWVTDNNEKTGVPKDKTIIKGDTENDSYIQGYLPLWQEWARQNPQLIEELRRNAAGKVLTDKYANSAVSQARALADILNQTADSEKRPSSNNTNVGTQIKPGSYIATRGYKKGDPQKHPEFDYVFTENAQAHLRSQLVNSDEESKTFTAPGVELKKDSDLPSSVFAEVNPTAYVKLNVSDVNGTNQAGIRTDEKGNLTPNAYGIIVKKNLQDVQGKFVAQEGTFLDTEEDFKLFTSLNEDVFNRLQNSSNGVKVFPQQMALGKAALPERFAEWLRDQLQQRFGIISKIEQNPNSKYSGYGLRLIGVNREGTMYQLSDELEEYTVYLGSNKAFDRRKYNYWTLDEAEARDYGSNVRSRVVNVTGYFNYYNNPDRQKLLEEFRNKFGKTFDILDNSEEGLQTQQLFFEFIESKGYRGITFIASPDLTDNRYIVTFDKYKNDEIEESTVEAAAEKVMNDNAIKRFKKYVTDPVNEDLNNRLEKILKKFHFWILKDDLTNLFGKDVIGALDFTQKILYLNKGGDLNAITEPEEFSHAFIKLMNAVYHREENRDEVSELYGKLRDAIEKTEFYKYVYLKYRYIYKYDNGATNEAQIKEEALGQALAMSIYEVYNREFKKDAGFFERVKNWFKSAIKKINHIWFQYNNAVDGDYSAVDLEKELDDIARSILDDSYQEKYLSHLDDSNYKLLDYFETIESVTSKYGNKPLKILQATVNNGGFITGSLSYRLQGTVYRPDIDSLHDIDTAYPTSSHDLKINRFVRFKLSPMETLEILDEIYNNYPKTANLLRKLQAEIPDCHIMYAYLINNNHTLIINVMSAANSELVDRFMKMGGNFTSRMHQFTEEERSDMYLIDLFFNDYDYTDGDYIVDLKYDLKHTNYIESFRAKLNMSRVKDIYDYQHYDPNFRLRRFKDMMFQYKTPYGSRLGKMYELKDMLVKDGYKTTTVNNLRYYLTTQASVETVTSLLIEIGADPNEYGIKREDGKTIVNVKNIKSKQPKAIQQEINFEKAVEAQSAESTNNQQDRIDYGEDMFDIITHSEPDIAHKISMLEQLISELDPDDTDLREDLYDQIESLTILSCDENGKKAKEHCGW